MDSFISIIMPVYNSSQYLEESIQSVINQDYVNWELICVDDGSTDESLKILKDYNKENKKIKVCTQENLGPAQARKLGISQSKGDYICYLDADDVYSKDYLYETLRQALLTDADVTMPILIGGWKSEAEYNFNDKNDLKFGEVIAPKCAFLRTFPWSVHGLNLYKASHIKKYALTEISNVNNFNADEYLTRYLLLFANKVVISEGKYFYRQNKESITQSFTIRHMGAIKVNSLLFDLAISEGFSKKELEIVANEIMISQSILKYRLLDNKSSFESSKFYDFLSNLEFVFRWEEFVNLNSIKVIMYYAFYKLPLNSSTFLVRSRERLIRMRY